MVYEEICEFPNRSPVGKGTDPGYGLQESLSYPGQYNPSSFPIRVNPCLSVADFGASEKPTQHLPLTQSLPSSSRRGQITNKLLNSRKLSGRYRV